MFYLGLHHFPQLPSHTKVFFYSKMAPTAEPKEDANLLLTLAVLSTCGELTPDYHKVCEKVGVSHARTAY